MDWKGGRKEGRNGRPLLVINYHSQPAHHTYCTVLYWFSSMNVLFSDSFGEDIFRSWSSVECSSEVLRGALDLFAGATWLSVTSLF